MRLSHLRRLFPVLLLAATLAARTFAASASVEERLAALEKQVADLAAENAALREKAGKPATAPAPAVSIGGKESKLILGGFAQLHAESGHAPDSRYTGIHDRFLLRRVRLNLRGSFTPEWSFKVESDFGANTIGASNGFRAQLTDAYVDWAPHATAQFRLGQFKTPFGWEQLMADTQNPFAERPLANDRLTVSRQVGLGLSGQLAEKRVDYSLGIFNGNGVNTSTNDNNAFMTAGRVAAKAWSGEINGAKSAWSVGANAFTSRDTGAFTGRRDGLGFDTQFSAGPATFRAEWLRNEFDPTVGADTTAEGWFATALYDLNSAWQLAVRFETYDANTATANNENDTWVFGFNHRIKGNDLMLTLNYFAGQAKFGGRDDRLIGRFQIVF